MEPQESHESVRETEKHNIHIDELFDHQEWKEKAEDPGVLESIGRQLDESLSTSKTGLQAYIDDLKLAYEMLRAPDFEIEKNTKIVLIIALLYIVSPIDLIPDSIPFIGLLDDILVAGYAIRQTAAELERYRQFKQRVR